MIDQQSPLEQSLVCAWTRRGVASPGLVLAPKKEERWWPRLILVAGNPLEVSPGWRVPIYQHRGTAGS